MRKTKNKTETKEPKKYFEKSKAFFSNRQVQSVLGVFILLFGLFLGISFISFFFAWQEDQSLLAHFTDKNEVAKNLLGKVGANLSHFFIYKGFGIAAFMIPFLLMMAGTYLLLLINLKKIFKSLNWGILGMIWIATSFGFTDNDLSLLSGVIGTELNDYLSIYMGKTGLALLLLFGYLAYAIIRFKITPEKIKGWFPKKVVVEKEDFVEEDLSEPTLKKIEKVASEKKEIQKEEVEEIPVKEKSEFELSVENQQPTIKNFSSIEKKKEEKGKEANVELEVSTPAVSEEEKEEVSIDIEETPDEEKVIENLSNTLVEKFGEFDPKLELANFKFPTLNLLKEYNESIAVDAEELEQNKNKIVDTLKNYKIGIAQIKATVGPTVTLYEIVPEAGIRISKIKNLEDDIALSLSALGIRIIAPIPGKGTIGIEVPNNKPTIVSMRSVISSTKFQESKMELPIAMGKNISNETVVIDLAKTPHLLMAGATGQGKSVGLNCILTSLLYKKHPAEVKFVLVDPKKVELTLFNKIERHYLAKLPGEAEAIITDTAKVVNTVNSLCIEMDNRYDLLKTAMVRNIKEYNAKFKARKLNPENGHQYLPYIVLVIDEFADLIMTAGKEVETPIARLAQLARAIGIHLIVATQRPSVNVITGMIKANFPARVAFRVMSAIDSKTILDASGANQLIGRGDMLYTAGNEAIRIQCAFVDTPEVEKITDFIGSQRAYAEAHILPEYIGEDGGTALDIDISDRDKLFEEAAKLIVIAQQGSASLLQRKLKLGYNRAGRLIDQLEAAGIVGPFEGSKARQVSVPDLQALDQLLADEKK
ncbi:FtsK/SpoIIIE family DNA translocase [Flavicella sediminum]|uniref:FtsK/SpoIIIE family DNA translocase n=1 Tax=Flavicella sediminum TaxID=2585141 RepID=UPI00111D6036|nr:DNA translocase FtsK [Flavicella sediminum]